MNDNSWYSPDPAAREQTQTPSAPQQPGDPRCAYAPLPVPGAPAYEQPPRPSEAQSAPQPERPAVSGRDKVFAWLTAIAGYVFFCAFPMSQKPLGAILFWIALYAFTFLIQLSGRERFRPVQTAVLVCAVLAAAAAFVWKNGFIAFFCFSYIFVAYIYLVYAVTGNTLEEGLSRLIGADIIRAAFVFPFRSFVRIWTAMFSRSGKSGLGRTLLKLGLGLLLAVIPTALVLALLSFDKGFTSLLEDIFRFESFDPSKTMLRLAFGIPLAMYLFGLYVSSVSGNCRHIMSAESCRAHAERRRVLPLVTAIAALTPLLLVYIIFFISQWGYYTSAFTGVLPRGLNYADYARGGFFELCAVSGINFVVIVCVGVFLKRGHKGVGIALSVVFALVTLILIATAMSKLILYIDEYGLSSDRVYAVWFMLLLTLLFILVIIGQFSTRFKTLPVCIAVTVFMFLLIALSGPNRWIAKYNVDRFLSGQAEGIDINYLYSLGPDAVPEMLRLDEELAERNGFERSRSGWPKHSWKDSYGDDLEAYNHLEYLLFRDPSSIYRYREYGIWSYTLSSARAEKLLSEAGFEPSGTADTGR